MSRKQELYLEILAWALPQARNGFSRFMRVRPFLFLSRRKLRLLRAHYEVAQLVHELAGLLLEENFTEHDLFFLNGPSRRFIERNDDWNCPPYSLFALSIQELFKAVPEELRHKLEWPGPVGDYAWARPRRGDEEGGDEESSEGLTKRSI